ncbi:MAG: hypothetical protein J0I14_01575 [Propionibacteriaceae bacterium]|nr:hypothetical protein [Propionibacteriaceae bacterium]
MRRHRLLETYLVERLGLGATAAIQRPTPWSAPCLISSGIGWTSCRAIPPVILRLGRDSAAQTVGLAWARRPTESHPVNERAHRPDLHHEPAIRGYLNAQGYRSARRAALIRPTPKRVRSVSLAAGGMARPDRCRS